MDQDAVLKATLPEFEREMVQILKEKELERGSFLQWNDPGDYMEHFVEEVLELTRAYFRGDLKEVKKEAVDVANMAYLIWRVT